MPRDGVLIAGFGGPDSPESVAQFMCNLMGREPSDALVSSVRAKYELIGGCSPLLGIARDLATELAAALAAADMPMPVEVGMRYFAPFIADGVASLVGAGVERVIIVSLSPYEAKVTQGEYRAAVEEALRDHPGTVAIEAPLLAAAPVFADLHAAAAEDALRRLGIPDAPVVFSAHSLPLPDVAEDDSYVRGLERTADAVALRIGLPEGGEGEVLPGLEAYGASGGHRIWLVAYQSKGARGGEWLGPDTDDVIAACAKAGYRGVAVVPLGFATDHMETLYDLDIVARRHAEEAGLAFERSAVPNADRRFAEGIAQLVVETASA